MTRVAFVVGDYPSAERTRREQVALSYSTPEVQVGIVSAKGTPYVHNLTPAELEMVAPAFIAAYRDAERQGYDAVVPLGTLDIAVDGGRSAVDIPVVAPSEAMFHIACILGRKFGLLVYHEAVLPLIRRIVTRYGMDDRVVAWRKTGFDLPDLAANEDAVKRSIVARARELVEEGADVVLPMGISQCPVFVKPDYLSAEIGVPVVEGIGAPIRFAAMLAGLGLRHSRKFWLKAQNL